MVQDCRVAATPVLFKADSSSGCWRRVAGRCSSSSSNSGKTDSDRHVRSTYRHRHKYRYDRYRRQRWLNRPTVVQSAAQCSHRDFRPLEARGWLCQQLRATFYLQGINWQSNRMRSC